MTWNLAETSAVKSRPPVSYEANLLLLLLLQKYEKPRVREDGYKDLLMYNRKVFNARQADALRSLYLWRDGVARQQDESTGFVCSCSLVIGL